MASLLACLLRRSRVLDLYKEGFLPLTEVSGWQLEDKGEVLRSQDDEVVVLMYFSEHGFGLPLHPFVWVLLFYYKLEIQNLHPNSILHIVCFITLCEAFLGIDPYYKLWQYLFNAPIHVPWCMVICWFHHHPAPL